MSLPPPLRCAWLASALEKLISSRGEETFLEAPIVLPEDRFFPDRWSPDVAGVSALARRLLAYAKLGHLDVSIETFENEQQIDEVGMDGRASKWSHAGAAAWFAGISNGRCRFGVELGKLTDPLGVVAAMAHEVGHAYRRAHRIEHADHDTEERLTDVTTIYLGFGVLTTAASARFTTKSHDNLGSSWSHQKQGYLAYEEMAYLLAVQLVARGYDASTIAYFAKRLSSNQAAVLREATRTLDRARVVDELGFDALPATRPSPVPAPWYKRIFR